MPTRYEFAWSLQTTTGVPLYLPSTSRRAVLPAGTLPAGQGSTVTLHARAVMADGSRLNATASVVLTPLVEPLVARIEGGSERTVDARRTVALDGSASFDPSNMPGGLSYAWRCVT